MEGASSQESAAPPSIAGGALIAQPCYLERPGVLLLGIVAVERGIGTGQAEGQCPLTRVGRYCPGPEEYYQGDDKGQD